MSSMRTIEIDFDVHKKIESERLGFSETPNDVLRRLLGILNSNSIAQPVFNSGRAWAGKGITLPHMTALRMEYNGRVYQGHIDDGIWRIEGKEFKSPSAAASGVAITKSGKLTNLDGWIYWHAKRPGDTDWIAIADLKPKISDAELDEFFKTL